MRDFIPSFLILFIAINWSNLSIAPENLFLGVLIMIIGLGCSVFIHFIATLPVFWLGDNQGIMELFLEIEDRSGHTNFVYEAWNNFWRKFFTLIFPSAISTALATSVIIGKSPGVEMLIVSMIVLMTFLIIVNILWRIAIRNYTSASS